MEGSLTKKAGYGIYHFINCGSVNQSPSKRQKYYKGYEKYIYTSYMQTCPVKTENDVERSHCWYAHT